MTDRTIWRQDDLPEAVRRALDLALNKQARVPQILYVSDVAGYTDWIIIVSGRSKRHVQGITEGIEAGLRQCGIRPRGTDGLDHHAWDLLDYDDFMVHVFYHPLRLRYDLESMWIDVPRVDLHLPEGVMDTRDLEGLEIPELTPEYRGDPSFRGYVESLDEVGEVGEVGEEEGDAWAWGDTRAASEARKRPPGR